MSFEHDKLITGNLTPPTNNTVMNRRYVGGFGQPKGFSSVMEVRVNEAGNLHIRVLSQIELGGEKAESLSIDLTNEQRKDLAKQLARHNPVKWENFNASDGLPKANLIVGSD